MKQKENYDNNKKLCTSNNGSSSGRFGINKTEQKRKEYTYDDEKTSRIQTFSNYCKICSRTSFLYTYAGSLKV